jgi:hypothetical protein
MRQPNTPSSPEKASDPFWDEAAKYVLKSARGPKIRDSEKFTDEQLKQKLCGAVSVDHRDRQLMRLKMAIIESVSQAPVAEKGDEYGAS